MHLKKLFATTTALLLLCAAQALHADDKHSDAEVLLFETNHLKKVTKPAALHYRFVKTGSMEDGFTDSVEIFIDKIRSNGTKSISANYLKGKNHIDFPPVEETEKGGNPVILYFLERDVREMKRLTGGGIIYFRKHIRINLADNAEVRPVKFTFGGREVNGKEIKITPYENDQLKERFGKHVGKYYVFTLSDDIPGQVFQVRCVTPDPQASGKQPLIEETLTFSEIGKKG